MTIGTCGCGRTWTGHAQAHCRTCHAHFGSVGGFDRHRSGGQCHDPATVASRAGRRVFRIDETPQGVTWVLASDRIHPQHAQRLLRQQP